MGNVTVEINEGQISEMMSGNSVEIKVDKEEFGVDHILVFPVLPGTMATLEKVKRAIAPTAQSSSSLNYIRESNKRKPDDKPGVKSKSKLPTDSSPAKWKLDSVASDVEQTMGDYLSGSQGVKEKDGDE